MTNLPVRTALALRSSSDEGFIVAQASDCARGEDPDPTAIARSGVVGSAAALTASGLDIFQALSSPKRRRRLSLPVTPASKALVDALRLGAIDYLAEAGQHPQRTENGAGRMPRNADLSSGVRPFEDEDRFGEMLGRSQPMKQLYRQIAKVAPTEAPSVFFMRRQRDGQGIARLRPFMN